MMLPFTGGGTNANGSSLGRRLQSRRGGGGGGGRSRQSSIPVSPLVVIVAAGTFLSLCLMALGWSIIVHATTSQSDNIQARTVAEHDASSNAVRRQSAAMPISMLRARLHHGYATNTINEEIGRAHV